MPLTAGCNARDYKTMPSPLRPSPAPTDGRDLVLVLDAPGAYVETLMKTSFSALTEKIILPGDRDRLGCVTQIRVLATCQRDDFSLCTSKFDALAVRAAMRRFFC